MAMPNLWPCIANRMTARPLTLLRRSSLCWSAKMGTNPHLRRPIEARTKSNCEELILTYLKEGTSQKTELQSTI